MNHNQNPIQDAEEPSTEEAQLRKIAVYELLMAAAEKSPGQAGDPMELHREFLRKHITREDMDGLLARYQKAKISCLCEMKMAQFAELSRTGMWI